MTVIKTNGLTLGYGEAIIIDSLDLAIPKGEITVLVGPNGCGKSTLLRSLARLLKPISGDILIGDKSTKSLHTKDIARSLAILPQGPVAPAGLKVKELVKQGRFPHKNWLKQWTREDEQIVDAALESTGMSDFAQRNIHALSGGQRQRAWISMALAQDTDIILLDEPTTYLDLTHQIEILDLLFDLNARESRTIVMVLHDLNLACRYAHNIIAVKDKKIYAQGRPENIITTDMIKNVFDMTCEVKTDPLFGTPLCIPHGKGRRLNL